MRLLIVILVTLVGLTLGASNTDWKEYIKKYGLNFQNNGISETERKSIWSSNIDAINAHNNEYNMGKQMYKKGVNQFTHLTYKEFLEQNTGYKKSSSTTTKPTTTTTKPTTTTTKPATTTTKPTTTTTKPTTTTTKPTTTTTKPTTTTAKPTTTTATSKITTTLSSGLPTLVNWTTTYLTGPIKNQGNCGSCWAFSAIAAIEGQKAKQTGKYVSLSDQQIVDCSKSNGACNGGDPLLAYKDILATSSKGVDTTSAYQYTSGTTDKSGSCLFTTSSIGATLTNYVVGTGSLTTTGNEAWLQNAVANIGPISVCIYVSSNFQNYMSGIFKDVTCSSTVYNNMNHCVAVVGYGTDSASGNPYWIVRNQWGTSWGENGYMRLLRNSGNQICISSETLYPIVN